MARNRGYWSGSGLSKKEYDRRRLSKAMATFSENYPGHEEILSDPKAYKAIAEFMGFVSKKFDGEYYDTDIAMDVFEKTRYKIDNEFVRDNYDYFAGNREGVLDDIKNAKEKIQAIKDRINKEYGVKAEEKKLKYHAPGQRDVKGRFVKGWNKIKGVWRDERGRFTKAPEPKLYGKYWRDAMGRFTKAPRS